MAQDKKPKSKVKIVLIILGVVGILAVMYVGLGLTSQAVRRQQVQEATANHHTKSVEYVQASIDVYYTYYGTYPINMDDLALNMRENKDGFWGEGSDPKLLQDSVTALKDFDYSKRGDNQAYRITYTDVYGEQIAVEANYRADYQ